MEFAYVIVCDDKFYKPVNGRWSGKVWYDSITDAKVYTKEAYAKARVTSLNQELARTNKTCSLLTFKLVLVQNS